jgi:hypothetical protein
MKYVLLITALITPFFTFADDVCHSDIIKATYNIEGASKATTSIKKNQLILLRHKNNVFHISDNTVATQWTKLVKDRIKKTSYFIDDKRAIEYEAEQATSPQAWYYHAQLLHPLFQTQSKLIKTTGAGCEQVEHYQQSSAAKTVDIWWYPQRKLVKRIKSVFADKIVTWKLEEMIDDRKMIQQQINTLYAYQSTDFADIGDNESDPFFRKMIHLGFIDHGASGFYDSEGNSLSSDHHPSH